MKREYMELMSKLLIFMFLTIIISLIIYDYAKKHYGYEYISMNDSFGIADYCYMNNKGLYCKISGNLVEVKQFRKR